jgi:hypothetical protein
MKIGTNLILLGILSMLIGTAFASPLLISELDPDKIKPFPEPPQGPTVDISSELLYANFSTKPNPDYSTLVQISYFVVLNITNNSEDWANITAVQVDAEVPNYTLPEDNSAGYTKSEAGRGWTAKEAWVDGKHYNLTWVPNKKGFGYQGDPELEGHWIEGVQIYEHYINYEYAYTRMNMNGTWVDVSGRIEVEHPINWPPTNLVKDGTIFSEIKFLRGGEFFNPEVAGLQVPIGVPFEFDECWAPHQSRLIVLHDTRSVPIKYYEPAKLELLKTEKTTFYTTVSGYLNSTTMRDSYGTAKNTIQIQLEPTEDEYLYSTLSENQKFVMDSFGAEVFIETRNTQ